MRAFIIVLLYFLFDRELTGILHTDSLSSAYSDLSNLFAVIIVVIALTRIRKKDTFFFWGSLFIVFLSLMSSTLIGNGDIRRAIMMMYPVFAMAALLLWQCSTLKKVIYFVRVISNLYLILAALNLFFMLYSPGLFKNTSSGQLYFLGGENHLGYPLLSGLCFAFLDYYFSRERFRLFVYTGIHIVTIFIVFSGSNVVGLVVMLLLVIPSFVQKIFSSVSLSRILLLFGILFSVIILFGGLVSFLNISIVSYLVEDVLGKNLTLTNRTVIWEIVISKFFESPILGYGVRETMNLFYISERYTQGYLSAHNQVLQSLYEGGVLFFLALIPLLRRFENTLRQTTPFICNVYKAAFCSVLVMYMAEAPGMDKILMLMVKGIVIAGVVSKNRYLHSMPN